MTDQPRDLAREVEEISKLHDAGSCILGVCAWHEHLGTVLDAYQEQAEKLASQSRDLEETTRVLKASNSALNKEHNERLRLEKELDAIKRTREQEEQYDNMCYELQLTREALRWALENRAGSNHIGGFRNGGCGCCGFDIAPPAHLAPILAKALEGKS